MKKILVPTDYSEAARNAADYAAKISQVLGRELVFFHAGVAVAEPEFSSAAAGTGYSGQQYLAEESFDINSMRQMIEKSHVNLLVMGTVGESVHKMFGSTTEMVLRHVKCPVIIVPPPYQYTPVRKIGFASDIAHLDEEAGKVIAYARCFNAEIEIFHISSWSAEIAVPEKINIRNEIELLKRVHQYANISYHIDEMPLDNENESITSFLAGKNVDLLAIYHNPNAPLESFFATVSPNRPASHLKIPVLVFPL
jgi:nucleotide-binding universal stress UspA family protein